MAASEQQQQDMVCSDFCGGKSVIYMATVNVSNNIFIASTDMCVVSCNNKQVSNVLNI